MKFIISLLMVLSMHLGLLAQTQDEWIEFSFKYIEENRLDSAEIALKNALALDPTNSLNPWLLNNLGTVQRRLGKSDEALLAYSAALGKYPKNSTFLQARASLFAEMGQVENAFLDYSTILEEDVYNQEALYQRGMLYLAMRNFGLAEADFLKILDVNPTSFYARLGTASVYKISGRYTDAEKVYFYLEDNYSENPNVYAGRAELYLLMEKPSKAINDVNKALRFSETESKNPYLYIIRAKARILLHEKQAAAEDVETAVELGYEEAAANELRQFLN